MCFCHDKCFPLRMRYVNATADFESFIKYIEESGSKPDKCC